MFKMRWFLSFLLLCFCGVAHALSTSGNRLLVVLEDAAEKDLYSTFWSDLEGRGFEISFESPKNEKLSLFHLGDRAYDHLLILPPKSKGLGPSLTPKLILDFLNKEGNVILALAGKSATPSALSSLLLEFDIHLAPDRSSLVVDHFNYDTLSASEKHDVLLLKRPGALRPDTKAYFSGDGVLAIPRAAPQTLGAEALLLEPILRAPETAYSYNVKEESEPVEDPFATGTQLALISALEARNSARFTVLGSAEILQDKWFSATVKGPEDKKETTTANREFAKQLTAWTFQEVGVVKVGRIEHRLVEEGQESPLNPKIYRVKNDIEFNIELSEYVYDKWVPFETPSEDAVQLEFTMLSPFHRLDLKPTLRTDNSTVYGVSFTVPDQHGIFSFRVNYKRPFLTNIEEKHEITIRHFAHDEYPRSWKISAAWPWISGLYSVIGGFLVFVVVWLYSAPSPSAEAKLKKAQ